jgi:hypothetical protein
MAHWPNSSRPALILPALMLRRIDVRHTDGFGGLPQGVTHVLPSVPLTSSA